MSWFATRVNWTVQGCVNYFGYSLNSLHVSSLRQFVCAPISDNSEVNWHVEMYESKILFSLLCWLDMYYFIRSTRKHCNSIICPLNCYNSPVWHGFWPGLNSALPNYSWAQFRIWQYSKTTPKCQFRSSNYIFKD